MMKLHYTDRELLNALNKGENVLGLTWVCIDDLFFVNKDKQCNRWYTMLLDSNGNKFAYLDFNYFNYTHIPQVTYGDILPEWDGLRITYFKILPDKDIEPEVEKGYIHLRHVQAISKDITTNSIQVDGDMVLVNDGEPFETNVLVTLTPATRKITTIPITEPDRSG